MAATVVMGALASLALVQLPQMASGVALKQGFDHRIDGSGHGGHSGCWHSFGARAAGWQEAGRIFFL